MTAAKTKQNIDELCINTIRTLSLDAIQKAESGHPGLPLGMAPTAYVLWTKFLRHRHPDTVRKTLSERSGRNFNSGR